MLGALTRLIGFAEVLVHLSRDHILYFCGAKNSFECFFATAPASHKTIGNRSGIERKNWDKKMQGRWENNKLFRVGGGGATTKHQWMNVEQKSRRHMNQRQKM